MRAVATPVRAGASRVRTKKLDMKSKLKHATQKEMSQLILDLAREHPNSECFAQFEPENMPHQVPTNWLSFCWQCSNLAIRVVQAEFHLLLQPPRLRAAVVDHTHTAPAGSPPGPSFHTCNGAAATTRNPRALPQDGADALPNLQGISQNSSGT